MEREQISVRVVGVGLIKNRLAIRKPKRVRVTKAATPDKVPK
jgi:hypothetical protein